MNIFEVILKANEEYTPCMQSLKDYICSLMNENEFIVGDHTFIFNPHIEWNGIITITEKETQEIIDFSQFNEQDPVIIKKGRVTKQAYDTDPAHLVQQAIQLLDGPVDGVEPTQENMI